MYRDIVYMVMCEVYIDKKSKYTKILPISNKKWSTFEAAFDEGQKYLDKEDIKSLWIETKCISRLKGV